MRREARDYARAHLVAWMFTLAGFIVLSILMYRLGGWPKVQEVVAKRALEIVGFLVGAAIFAFVVYVQALLFYELQERIPLGRLAVAEAYRKEAQRFEDSYRNAWGFSHQHQVDSAVLAKQAVALDREREELCEDLRRKLDEWGLADPGTNPLQTDSDYNYDKLGVTISREFNVAMCRLTAVTGRVSSDANRLMGAAFTEQQK
jgi:hypothetical protein